MGQNSDYMSRFNAEMTRLGQESAKKRKKKYEEEEVIAPITNVQESGDLMSRFNSELDRLGQESALKLRRTAGTLTGKKDDEDIAPVANNNANRQLSNSQKKNLETYSSILSTRMMPGQKHSVLEEAQIVASMDEGEEKEYRKKALLKELKSSIKNQRWNSLTQPLDDGWDNGDISSIILEGFSRLTTVNEFNEDDLYSLLTGETRDADFWDLTLNSVTRGYNNSRLGEESFAAMNGQSNEKETYQKILEGDKYQFEPSNWFEKGVSGAFELVGQMARQTSNPRTLGVAGGAAGAAAIAGQVGPQVLAPEEIVTVPVAFTAGLAAGNAASALEIEAGHAYNEMLEAGVSEKTARRVALAVGTVNAGLEMLQVDELLDAYKITNATGATKKFTKRILKELADRGIDVATETAQEVAQEGVTIAGTQFASKAETGEWAYDAGEVGNRLKDTAISSGLSFGMMNVPAATKNVISNGTDQNNIILTEDERAVVDKEVERRISEREKGGEKLSVKEKSAIEAQVERDLEKGYIPTETIESVLGDSTAYDSLLKESEEFNTLYETATGELSKKQQDRLAELEAKNKANPYKDALKTAKSQYSQSVRDRVNGSRLAESYNEIERKKQDFQADYSKFKKAKYQDAVKQTIDNAIKAGANNTNRVHDIVDFAAKIAGDTGKSFDFKNAEQIKADFIERQTKLIAELESLENRNDVQNEKLAQMKDVLEKVKSGETTVNGSVSANGIVLNLDSGKPLNRIVGHEITHVFEPAKGKETKEYTALRDTLYKYAKAKNIDVDQKLTEYKALYEGLEADAEREMIADMVGDFLFSDIDFVNHLSVENRNLFQKIYDEIKYMLKVATAGSKEARELERVKKAFEDIYRANEKSAGNTNYSLENGNKRKYNKRSRYSETETLFLSWENSSAPAGEVKRFVRFGKARYYEKTENGCVELSKSQYNERKGINVEKSYRRAESRLGATVDYDENTQRGLLGDTDSHRDAYRNATVFGQAISEELRHDTAGSEPSNVGHDSRNDINQSEYNEEASDNPDASFITFSNDYAAIRNYMKDGDTGEKYSLGYHAGDLGKAEGYWNMMSSNRGTGHFGTGTYFVGDEAKISDSHYGNRPHEKVDFNNYKLFKPVLESDGFDLHSALKYINDNIFDYPIAKMSFDELWDVRKKADDAEYTLWDDDATEAEKAAAQNTLDDLKERFESVGYDPAHMDAQELYEELNDITKEYHLTRSKLEMIFWRDMGGLSYEEQSAKIDSIMQGIYDEVSKIGDAYAAKHEDSPSTRFMKALGYEGIDVRGFNGLDNTTYGSVIYDLKGDDLARKQEIGTAKYSLSDSSGRQLTNEQKEYFKDSVVRDENGNLKVMYHGTSKGGHTVFDTYGSNYGLFGTGSYFTDNKDIAQSYTKKGKGNNPQVYESYLNIKNPIDMDAQADRAEWAKAFEDVDFPQSGTNEQFYRAVEEFYADQFMPKWEVAEIIQESLQSGMGYDGITHIGGGRVNPDGVRHQVYIAFDPEQIKNTDNEKPTSSPDIRYSLSEDSQGRELSSVVANRFANSKVVDENGNLKVVYHGTAAGEFSIFDKSKGSVEGDFGSGFYFSDDSNDVATNYEGGGPDFDNKVARLAERIEQEEDIGYEEAEKRARQELYKSGHKFEVYLNIENPAIVGETILFDSDSYYSEYDQEDYDNEDDYYSDVEQLLVDEIDNIIWEIERNVDVNTTDGIADVLWGAFNEGGIDLEGLKKRINQLYLEDSEGNFVGNEVTRQIVESLGYDGIIDPTVSTKFNMGIESGAKHYIVFKPNQIKSVTNQNPTDNPDIHRSLSNAAEGFAPIRENEFFGKDFGKQEEVAPVVENAPAAEIATQEATQDLFPNDLAPAESELSSLIEERTALEETLLEMVNNGNVGEEFNRLSEQWDSINQRAIALENELLESESGRIDSLTDSDVPPEMDAPYAGEASNQSVPDPFADRDMFDVGNKKVKAYMYENPEVKPFFQDAALGMLDDLHNGTKGEKWFNDDVYYESGGEKGWGGTKRTTTPDIADLLDNWHYTYDQIDKGLNAIIEDNGKENNAVSKRIEFMLDYRLRNGYTGVWGEQFPPDQGYINLLKEKQINEYSEEAFNRFMENADQYAPIAPVAEETPVAPVTSEAPVKEQYEAVTPKRAKEPKMVRVDTAKAEQVARVLVDEPATNKKKTGLWSLVKEYVLDNGMVFEDLSKKTKNRNIEAKWNFVRYARGMAQHLMESGADGVKSLKSIMDEANATGKTEAFFEYLYHMHNVDRMSLEGRYDGVPNKAVFGDSVTAEMSRAFASDLVKENPEFRRMAQDVYRYNAHLRQLLVDGGVISQETADLWAEMYPHYVPIRRAGHSDLSINVPLDTKKTGVNAPIKRATGGSDDILNLFDTMGQRTIQTLTAVAKNRFGVELKNALGSIVDSSTASVDEVIDSIDTHEELLQAGKNGMSPTFTVFENGEKVTFEITEEMYQAMRPTSELLSHTIKPLNVASNIHRGVLTEYNPVFMITNAIKDAQDVLINSQHPLKTYAKFPMAVKELTGKGKWYNEYMENGGEHNSYFDTDTNTFQEENKVLEGIKKWTGLGAISNANNFIERVPRLAEYIASREAGRSIEESMLDAARVTTNFAAGGKLTKALNRNGFTFLNASMQGAVQQVRNIREAKMNGLRGTMTLAAKFAVAGLIPALLNGLLWEDDEEYEELSDYVKDNYYIVAKYGDGQFVRIPKGRTTAVIQSAFEQMGNLITGNDEVDLKRFGELLVSNLAPNNPLDNNIIAPVKQALTNTTWYGDDLVPTRLQDLPAAEQYDETTDSISRWLGEKAGEIGIDISPVKINYLLDQYTGGVGDTILPMLTPAAESGDNTFVGNLLAPFKDKFTTDSVLKNQNVSDFYEKVDELAVNAKKSGATDEDILMSKYMNSASASVGQLYGDKRKEQNTNLPDDQKYQMVRGVQQDIVDAVKNALGSYEDVTINGDYATVGDMYFHKKDGEWQKMSKDQVSKYNATSKAGDAPYATDGINHYRYYTPEGETEAEWRKLTDEQVEKQKKVTSGLGITPEEYWGNKEEYDYAYENPENYAVAKAVGGYESYRTYSSELYDIKADKDKNGKSISGSRKEKVFDYVFSLNIDEGMKFVLLKSEYNADDSFNYEIIEYLNGRDDLSYEEKVTVFKKIGFNVDSNGYITW